MVWTCAQDVENGTAEQIRCTVATPKRRIQKKKKKKKKEITLK